MTEAWKRVTPHGRSTRRSISRVVWIAAGCVLLLAGLQPRLVEANPGTTGDRRLLAPIVDVLSASSWIWATGQDPRYPSGMQAEAIWPPSGEPTATSSVAEGNAVVSRVVGQFPVTTEPSLAVNPTNPDHLVLAVSALDLPSAATYVSENAGETWSGPFQAPYFAGDEASLGAPVVAFDREGSLILVSRSVAVETIAVGIQQLPVERVRIAISRSEDGGRHWGSAVSAVAAEFETSLLPDQVGLTAGGITAEFLDGPSIAIGIDPQRPDREIITLAFTAFRSSFVVSEAVDRVRVTPIASESTIQVISSIDDGQSWSDSAAVSPTVARSFVGAPIASPAQGDAFTPEEIGSPVAPAASSAVASDGDQVVQGPQVAVLADGTIAAAYFDSSRDGPGQGLAQVMVALSNDGGRTFDKPRQAGLFREIPRHPATAFFRWWDGAFPRIGVGPDDELYIAVAAPIDGGSRGASGLQLFRSLDRGESWDSPVRESWNGDGSQFFPAVSVASDGTLFAIWAELGNEPAGAGYTIRASASMDNGETWRALDASEVGETVTEISATPSNSLVGYPRGSYLGSRLALVVTDDILFAAWPETEASADGRLGQQIAVKRISTVSSE